MVRCPTCNAKNPDIYSLCYRCQQQMTLTEFAQHIHLNQNQKQETLTKVFDPMRFVLMLSMCLLVILLLVVVFWEMVGGDLKGQLENPKNIYFWKTQTASGQAAIAIRVSGRNGTQVSLMPKVARDQVIVDGKAEFILPIDVLLPEKITKNQKSFSPEVVVHQAYLLKSSTTPLELPQIAIPTVAFALIYPTKTDAVVYEDRLPLQCAFDRTATVTLNGRAVKADAKGVIREWVEMKAGQTQWVTLIATAPKKRATTLKIRFTRSAMPIVLSANVISIDQDIATIQGNMDTNATLSLDTPLVSPLKPRKGHFEVKCRLLFWGDNVVTLIARGKSGKTSLLRLHIERKIQEKSYISMAQELDFPSAMMHTQDALGKIFVLRGTVLGIDGPDVGQRIFFSLGNQRSVLIDNAIGKPMRVGQQACLYADLIGKEGDVLLLNAKYVK